MMDMSVVSRKLEKETKSSIRGTVNGRIPRMLLIQVSGGSTLRPWGRSKGDLPLAVVSLRPLFCFAPRLAQQALIW